MDNRRAIHKLLTAYLDKQISRDEFDQLFAKLAALEDDAFRKTIYQALDNPSETSDADFIAQRVASLYPQLQAKIHRDTPVAAETPRRTHRVWWNIPAAAAALIFLFTGIYFFIADLSQPESAAITPAQILPGGNRATLTLVDGQTVNLSSEESGIVIGDEISYLSGSEILDYGQQATDNRQVSRLMSLTTPKGGQYQITLADGTHLWLNAASSLTYPVAFDGDKREVSLQGEAYFEVSKDQSKPFIVNTVKQRIEVLGTSFNINAYNNEVLTKTTLLTGSVQVYASTDGATNGKSQVLTPNQQSVVDDSGEISVNKIDPYTAIAWKDGLFNFHGLSIDESLKQVERWYDVDVIYQGKKPIGYLGGKMSRGVKLSTFLSFLEKDFHIKSELKANRTLVLYASQDNE
ncbi:FecR family protein [Parapedobacter tibetensis]|uniref:FecR family protein n=1 Tax=Parapedobacter tibetensis TaxID=2972951 RepID=UPI00214DC132|nr:FecR family protein [Parapedobacter tibetensis]